MFLLYEWVFDMSTKRKHVVVTNHNKLEAIREVVNSVLLWNVAANYGVGIWMESEWVKSKSKLQEYYSNKVIQEKSAPGHKQRIAILACANAAGYYRLLLMLSLIHI